MQSRGILSTLLEIREGEHFHYPVQFIFQVQIQSIHGFLLNKNIPQQNFHMCPRSHEDDPSNPLSLDASAEFSLINLHLTALTISLLPLTLCDSNQQLRVSYKAPLWQRKTWNKVEDEGIMRMNRQLVHSTPFIKGGELEVAI